jgi:hypothetical protein
MRSEEQRNASRINGAKSRGPKTDEGKAVSKMNRLTHGLRAEQVVLPHENPAEFEAEKQAWFDDWRPMSHTRAVLVERAAAASWRLRRAVRDEAARLRKAADDAARDFDLDRIDRADRAIRRFEDDPAAAVTLLGLDATGLDRLIRSWRELARALGHGPGGWSEPMYHARLMLLLGRRPEAGPIVAGPEAVASSRLLAANDRESPEPMPDDEALDAVAALRRLVAKELRDLRGRRREAEPPAEARLRAVATASAEATASKAEQLRHRYEMAHERSLRAAIKDLAALEKSGADEVCRTEPVEEKEVTTKKSEGGSAPVEVAPTEANSGGRPASTAGSRRGGKGRDRVVEGAEVAVSPPSHS